MDNDQLDTLWRWLRVDDQPQHADAVLLFGRSDYAICERAYLLYKQHHVDRFICTGTRSTHLANKFDCDESTMFERWLVSREIDRDVIVTEHQSHNTSENVIYGVDAARRIGWNLSTLLLVTHGAHARRAWYSTLTYAPGIASVMCADGCVLTTADAANIVDEVRRISDYRERNWLSCPAVPQYILAAARGATPQ